MGEKRNILCTVIVLSILVFGSVFEENIGPTIEAQLSSTLKITKLTTGGNGIFDFTVTGTTSYNPSINTGGGGGVLFDQLNVGNIDYNLANSFYPQTINLGLIMPFNGESISKVTFRISSDVSSGSLGTLKAVIYSGVDPEVIELGDNTYTLLASSQTFQSPWDDDGIGGSFITTGYHDVVATFDPPVTVSGSNIFVGVEATNIEDGTSLLISQGGHGVGKICAERTADTLGNFFDCGYEVAMKIESSGSGGSGTDGLTLVEAGTYSIQETVTSGWSLADATCNDGSSSFSVDTVSGIQIGPGDNIECIFENTFATATPDNDFDGIYNAVDTLPDTSSDDFSDVSIGGTSSGTITTRGNQILTITEEPNPDGVRIDADISGGVTPATVSVCAGASTIDLTAGDEIIVTCGSVIIKTISGQVEVVLIASDGTHASTSIPYGNEITFDPQTSTINANPDNTDTVIIMIGNTLIPITPGSSDFSDVEPPQITINSLINDGNSFNFGNIPPEPTCTAQDELSGVNGNCSVIGYQTGVGTHQIQFSASDLAGNTNTITIHYQILPWSMLGFYPPVDMNGIVNTVKGGSTVPLKFEVFSGSIEKTSTSDISSFTQNTISCSALIGNPEDVIEITTNDLTGLQYTGGQFHANWKTPKSPNTCWKVKVVTTDGSSLSAFFKLK